MIKIVVHRISRSELDLILAFLVRKLPPCKYDTYHHKISIEKGLIESVEIDGRSGDYCKMYGLEPDFYNTDSYSARLMLRQVASKVNGEELPDVMSIIKIVDCLKIPYTGDKYPLKWGRLPDDEKQAIIRVLKKDPVIFLENVMRIRLATHEKGFIRKAWAAANAKENKND